MSAFQIVKLDESADLAGIHSELISLNGNLEIMNANNRAQVMEDFAAVAHIVRKGDAEKVFDIGDQLITEYTSTAGTKYAMPWDIVHIGPATLEDGEVVPGLWIQSHYATIEEILFLFVF